MCLIRRSSNDIVGPCGEASKSPDLRLLSLHVTARAVISAVGPVKFGPELSHDIKLTFFF